MNIIIAFVVCLPFMGLIAISIIGLIDDSDILKNMSSRKYRIIKTSNNKDNYVTYTVQGRILFLFWVTVQVHQGFDIWGEATYYSFNEAKKLKQKLEIKSSTKYSKQVI